MFSWDQDFGPSLIWGMNDPSISSGFALNVWDFVSHSGDMHTAITLPATTCYRTKFTRTRHFGTNQLY